MLLSVREVSVDRVTLVLRYDITREILFYRRTCERAYMSVKVIQSK